MDFIAQQKLDIASFTQASGAERFIIKKDDTHVQLVPGDLSLEQKFQGVSESTSPGKAFSSLRHGAEYQKNENREFKAAFHDALAEAYGEKTASGAVNSVGLPLDWKENSSVLSKMEVDVIVGKARENLVDEFIRGGGKDSLSGVLHTKIHDLKEKQHKRADLFTEEDKQNLKIYILLKGYENSPELLKLFRDKVSQHKDPHITKLKEIALETYAEFFAEKKTAFAEAYPMLSAYANTGYLDHQYLSFTEAYQVLINEINHDHGTKPRQIERDDPLNKDKTEFRNLAWDVLDLLRAISNSPKESKSARVLQAQEKLSRQKYSNEKLVNLAVTEAGQQLAICLSSELACQLDRREMQ